MKPAMIQAHLKMHGLSQRDIARKLGDVSDSAINLVIYGRGRSRRIEKAIAMAIHKPLCEVFPKWHQGPDADHAERLRREAVSAAANAFRARLACEIAERGLSHAAVADLCDITVQEVDAWFASDALPSVMNLLNLAQRWPFMDLGYVMTGVQAQRPEPSKPTKPAREVFGFVYGS